MDVRLQSFWMVMKNVLDNLNRYRVILGSASPRRRELLAILGVEFEVRPLKGLDETYPASLPPLEVAPYLALQKATHCRNILAADELVITADTVVVCDDKVLGKPHDAEQAAAMLRMLSGRSHTVVTGIAVSTATRTESATAHTTVHFAPLSEEEIAQYITLYRPFDKAGAYGIQEWIGAIGITGIEGSFYNVMGLPLHRLYTLMRRF